MRCCEIWAYRLGTIESRRQYQVNDVTVDECSVVLTGVFGYPYHIDDISFALTSIANEKMCDTM